MDSLSQLLLGAAVGYAVAGKKLGKKSLLIGGFAGTLPDLDVIPLSLFKDDFIMLKHHRGFTHSILFSLLAPIPFSKLTQKLFKTLKETSLSWLYFWAFLTHSLLDCFTTWGTQLFWPFSYRVALNSIFIIDPAYTIWLLLTVIICSFIPVSKKSVKIMYTGIILSSFYLLLSLGIKLKIHKEFIHYFKSHNINVTHMMTRPSPFNIILWSATAKTEDGYYMAFRSLLDTNYNEPPKLIPNKEIKDTFLNDEIANYVKFVTNKFYTQTYFENGVYIHDLRFGSFNLLDPSFPAYIFSYKLIKTSDGKTVMKNQNPKFKDTSNLFTLLFKRIQGH